MRTAISVAALFAVTFFVLFVTSRDRSDQESALEQGSGPAPIEASPESELTAVAGDDDRTVASDSARTPESESAAEETADTDSADASLTAVVRGADGTPREGIHVIVRTTRKSHGQLAYHRERTDAEGTARFAALPSGRLDVCTDRTGWRPVEEIELAPGEAREVEITLPEGLVVAGRVVDADGAPVAGAGIWLTSRTTGFTSGAIATHADGGGNFELRDVPKEPSLGAIAAGYAPSELVDLELMDTTASPVRVLLELTAGGATLEGRVVDAGGAPVSGATVALGSDSGWIDDRPDETVREHWRVRSAVTDEAGAYRMVGLPPGEDVLRVRAPRTNDPWLAVHREDVELQPNETLRLDVTLVQAATVFGVVRDEAGQPMAGGTVRAFDTPLDRSFLQSGQVDDDSPFGHAATLVDDAGRFRLEGAPTGTVHLYAQEARKKRMRMGSVVRYTSAELELVPGEEREWSPVLGDGHVIEGAARYRDGTPLTNVFVNITRSGADARDRRALYTEDGSFRFVQLDDAPYDVRVQIWDLPEGKREPRATGVRPDGEPLELVADFDAPVEYEESTVRVRVVDSAQRVPEGASLGVVLEPEDSNSWHLPDQEGDVWVFDVDEPGRYRVVVMKGERAIHAGDWVDVPEAATVDLGTVQTESGATLVVELNPEEGHVPAGVMMSFRSERCRRSESFEFAPGQRTLTLEGLLVGPGKLDLVGDNIQRTSVQVTLDPTAPTTATIDLVAAVPVPYVIARSEGLDPGSMEAVFTRRDTGEVVREVSVRDLARFGNPIRWTAFLGPGPYRLEVTLGNGMGATREFEVTSLDPGDVPEVAIEF